MTTTMQNAKAAEAASESTQAPPPPYPSADTLPPSYQEMRQAISKLSSGDPNETISVPMTARTISNSIHNYNPFSRKEGSVKQSIVVRQMTREMYNKHYAKDAEGNYVGTGRAAPDAGLVFVPGKSTPEDLVRQAEEVAFGKQQLRGKGIGKFGMPLKGPEGSTTGSS